MAIGDLVYPHRLLLGGLLGTGVWGQGDRWLAGQSEEKKILSRLAGSVVDSHNLPGGGHPWLGIERRWHSLRVLRPLYSSVHSKRLF